MWIAHFVYKNRYEAAAELARRVGGAERDAALRLAAREAELQQGATARLRQVCASLFWHLPSLHSSCPA
jgi:hypothetical protein